MVPSGNFMGYFWVDPRVGVDVIDPEVGELSAVVPASENYYFVVVAEDSGGMTSSGEGTSTYLSKFIMKNLNKNLPSMFSSLVHSDVSQSKTWKSLNDILW